MVFAKSEICDAESIWLHVMRVTSPLHADPCGAPLFVAGLTIELSVETVIGFIRQRKRCRPAMFGEHSLEHARGHGYKAMQFNFVVASNERARRLW